MSGADARAIAAQKALAALDHALSNRPKQTGHDFSAATRCLTALREHVIVDMRGHPAAATRDHLARLNAVISVVYGGQFPIGAVPWDHVQQARDTFVRLLRDMGLAVDQPATQS